MKRILAVRVSALGDVVLTTPALRALAAAHPGAELHLVTDAGFAPILEGLPFLTRVHRWDEGGRHVGARGLSQEDQAGRRAPVCEDGLRPRRRQLRAASARRHFPCQDLERRGARLFFLRGGRGFVSLFHLEECSLIAGRPWQWPQGRGGLLGRS